MSSKYYTEIPNIVNDNLKCPYAFNLYSKYKRIGGDEGRSWVKNEDFAKICGMSESKLRRVRKELEKPQEIFGNKTLIRVQKRKSKKGQNLSDIVTIVDIWDENYKYYIGLNKDDV